jgi:hypothetical protein
MEFTVRIRCDNASFDDQAYLEVNRILMKLVLSQDAAEKLVERPVLDINGNRVGESEITLEDSVVEV